MHIYKTKSVEFVLEIIADIREKLERIETFIKEVNEVE
nr:MAG TPA: hypothetical protein [Caudoviricetes sp.]